MSRYQGFRPDKKTKETKKQNKLKKLMIIFVLLLRHYFSTEKYHPNKNDNIIKVPWRLMITLFLYTRSFSPKWYQFKPKYNPDNVVSESSIHHQA